MPAALLDRLAFTEARVAGMVDGLRPWLTPRSSDVLAAAEM